MTKLTKPKKLPSIKVSAFETLRTVAAAVIVNAFDVTDDNDEPMTIYNPGIIQWVHICGDNEKVVPVIISTDFYEQSLEFAAYRAIKHAQFIVSGENTINGDILVLDEDGGELMTLDGDEIISLFEDDEEEDKVTE